MDVLLIEVLRPQLPDLRTVTLKSTKHNYGATKTPSLTRVSTMLNNCPNLEVNPCTHACAPTLTAHTRTSRSDMANAAEATT